MIPKAQQDLVDYLCLIATKLGPILPIYGIDDAGRCACGRGDCEKNQGKHPNARLVSNGVNGASRDPKLIAEWVRTGGKFMNWGLATGHEVEGGYLVVLDLDGRNGGHESILAFDTPDTIMAASGSGDGSHRLYVSEKQLSSTVVAPGLDRKGYGGFIVIEPSRHRSGKTYAWELLYHPEDTNLAPAPEWLVAGGKVAQDRPAWTGASARDSILGVAFEKAGWLGVEISEGRWMVRCPWSHLHSDGRGCGTDSSTVILPPTEGNSAGGFACKHEHCANKSWQEVIKALPVDAARAARNRFEVVPDAGTRVEGNNLVTVTGELSPAAAAGVREHLAFIHKKDGTKVLKKDLVNAVSLFNHDPRWRGVIQWNAFSNQILVSREPSWHEEDKPDTSEQQYPRQWRDSDDTLAMLWLARYWGLEFEAAKINAAVIASSQKNGYHPVRDYLGALEWDGVPRLDSWLVDYCGADDSEYTRKVGAWWLISAIARVKKPGCEAHHVLILEGEQGIGKSTVLKILGGPWFTDSSIDLGSKDAYQTIQGRWIIELAELDSLGRSDAARAKAFFTSPTDTYRPSYGRAVVSVPRQCVFAGTVNHAEYLRDETGNRRYWPVHCRRVLFDKLAEDRDQLWAEAMRAFESGRKWWPATETDRALCEAETSKREFSDEWEAVINTWLRGHDAHQEMARFGTISVGAVMKGALKMEVDSWKQSEMTRVGRAMQRLGYKKVRVQREGHSVWVFKK